MGMKFPWVRPNYIYLKYNISLLEYYYSTLHIFNSFFEIVTEFLYFMTQRNFSLILVFTSTTSSLHYLRVPGEILLH